MGLYVLSPIKYCSNKHVIVFYFVNNTNFVNDNFKLFCCVYCMQLMRFMSLHWLECMQVNCIFYLNKFFSAKKTSTLEVKNSIILIDIKWLIQRYSSLAKPILFLIWVKASLAFTVLSSAISFSPSAVSCNIVILSLVYSYSATDCTTIAASPFWVII